MTLFSDHLVLQQKQSVPVWGHLGFPSLVMAATDGEIILLRPFLTVRDCPRLPFLPKISLFCHSLVKFLEIRNKLKVILSFMSILLYF